jgi:23S rRNA pseudouridine1911/1915/1917 synthase
MTLTILYKDKYLVAVEKPAGLNTETDSLNNPSLQNELKKQLSKPFPLKYGPGVIHRLDRPVSGIVLFALSPTALKKMNELFAARKIKKVYRALVRGKAPAPAQKLKHYLLKDKEQKKAIISSLPAKNYLPVSLSYKVISHKDNISELEIELHTGKYHQIRAQLAAINLPIIGDVLYGGESIKETKQIMLHAYSLAFVHPISGEKISISSNPQFSLKA